VVRESDKNLKYLGAGAVWKDPNFEETGRFICNYSEHREEADGKVTQNILFAWSTDLIHWNKFGEEYMFRVDEGFYDKYGRWDCIFPMSRAEGGYWGTWTATAHPDSEVKGIVGIGYSEDGVIWMALEPPVVEPGVGESGAFYRFGDRIYAMFGAGGMWNYSAEKVTGPYTREKKNALLLQRGHSYFSRYLPTPEGVLVNHQVMSGNRIKKDENEKTGKRENETKIGRGFGPLPNFLKTRKRDCHFLPVAFFANPTYKERGAWGERLVPPKQR